MNKTNASCAMTLMTLAGLALAGCASGVKPGAQAPASAPAPAGAPMTKPSADLGRIEGARDRVFPALVNIRVITVAYWGGQERKGSSNGSGTIITPQGHIVTNHHVIDRGTKFRVTLADKTEVEADLVGSDPMTDLAVLRIRESELARLPNLPVAAWGDSDRLSVGQTVMSMGSPFSLSRTVTLGIVSNTQRVFFNTWTDDRELEPDDIDGQSTGVFTTWVQHDALINPGNSGGPLVNLDGEIVGVNTRGGSGIGFASPANLARFVAQRLIDTGEVQRSDLGMSLKPIDRTGHDTGVLVNAVSQSPPGAAARAGVQAGDVITAIDGQPVTVKFIEQVPPLLRSLAERPVGSTVRVDYVRAGNTGSATITTERLLPERGEETALRAWGLSVAEITERIARERRLPRRDGVLITGVRGGSPAVTAEPPISPGDVLLEINGRPVIDVPALVEAYRTIMGDGRAESIPETMLVRFDRNGKDNVTILKPRPKPTEDPTPEVPKAWIGVAVQPVLRELAKSLAIEGTTGFRVTRVYPRTLAAGSDLRVGDVITAVNDEKLAPRTLQDSGLFARRVRQMKIDDSATLTVLREGKSVAVPVKLERTRLGPDEARKDDNKDFELSVRELTFFDRDDANLDESVQGVLVTNVEPAGWAGQGGLGEGDIVQTIDGASVADVPAFRRVMADIARRQPERVVFVVLRGTSTSFKFVEPEWKPKVTSK
jgi:serine protease Do